MGIKHIAFVLFVMFRCPHVCQGVRPAFLCPTIHVNVHCCLPPHVKHAPRASTVKGEPRRAENPRSVPTSGDRTVEGGHERCHRRYKPGGERDARRASYAVAHVIHVRTDAAQWLVVTSDSRGSSCVGPNSFLHEELFTIHDGKARKRNKSV